MKQIILSLVGLLAAVTCWASDGTLLTRDTDNTFTVDGAIYSLRPDGYAEIVDITESVVDFIVPESVTINGDVYEVLELIDIWDGNTNTTLKSINTGHITTIMRRSFTRFQALERVDMPNVNAVDDEAFRGCVALESVNLPKAGHLCNGCFRDCTSLRECILPSVYSIEENIFLNCTSLERVIFEAPSVTMWGRFDGHSTLSDYFTGFFAECSSLRELVIMGRFAYKNRDYSSDELEFRYNDGLMADELSGCTALEKLYVNYDQLYMEYVVSGAKNLKSITIGNNCVSYLECNAFNECDIQEIHCMFPIPPVSIAGDGEPIDVNKQTCTVYVPKGCRERYMQSEYWSQYANIIEDTNIEPLFDPADGPKEPQSGLSQYIYRYMPTGREGELSMAMSYYQFVDMDGDTPLFINYHSNMNRGKVLDFKTPEGPMTVDGTEYVVTEIAPFAGSGFLWFLSVTIGENITAIGDYAFANSKTMYYYAGEPHSGTVSLPSTLQSIGQHAFENARNVATIICYAMTPPALADDRFFTNAEVRGDITLNVPAEAVAAYEAAPVWRDFRIVGIDGVETVAAEVAEGDAEYYNLQGIRVTPDRAGVYIRRAGGEVTKVMIR